MANTDRALRSLSMQKSTKAIEAYRMAMSAATDAEKAFLSKQIASHQDVLDQGNAMIEVGL